MNAVKRVIRLLCFLSIIAGASYILSYVWSWQSNEDIYRKIYAYVSETEPETNIDLEAIGWQYWNDEALRAFKAENPDCVAMLCIPGTMLKYPVVQTLREEGSFYLYRDFYGKKNVNGTVFLDSRCELSPDPFNLILYGHNMRNGSMFGMVKRYVDESFFSEHPSIYFNYGQKYKKYDICSVITLSADIYEDKQLFNIYKDPTEEDRDEFVSLIEERSIYDTGIKPKEDDNFIMLSTCYYGKSNGRVMVVARQDKGFEI